MSKCKFCGRNDQTFFETKERMLSLGGVLPMQNAETADPFGLIKSLKIFPPTIPTLTIIPLESWLNQT